jgi:hypothetical protein
LRPREARLEVIRRALTETAGDVKASEHWTVEDSSAAKQLPQEDCRLAEVAVAGYRLLDPRRRRTLFERVQLLLWTEDDLDGVSGSLWDVAPVDSEKVGKAAPEAAGVTPKPVDGAPPATQLGEETQAALEAIRSLRRRDRRATALWISVAALAVSLPGAVALVLALV